jgi:hypothetical protein
MSPEASACIADAVRYLRKTGDTSKAVDLNIERMRRHSMTNLSDGALAAGENIKVYKRLLTEINGIIRNSSVLDISIRSSGVHAILMDSQFPSLGHLKAFYSEMERRFIPAVEEENEKELIKRAAKAKPTVRT